ncbi:hypothetical protein P5673_017066 [Acropora cervicornis]|uniref:Uncharacterized protein n=1 Tax=Acropora cervicornis TaxID=6130 RepID=A0AAD9V465_ACRCE|nr:hypothetical protein P5673_017066 [Acropora cervicornis]
MDPEFAGVIFVEETRKLHLKSSNEIKVSCLILRSQNPRNVERRENHVL